MQFASCSLIVLLLSLNYIYNFLVWSLVDIDEQLPCVGTRQMYSEKGANLNLVPLVIQSTFSTGGSSLASAAPACSSLLPALFCMFRSLKRVDK
jgi:hypothetical protein